MTDVVGPGIEVVLEDSTAANTTGNEADYLIHDSDILSVVNELRDAIGEHAVIISLGDDGSRILAASSKKSRFALATELKKFGFVSMEIPKDFKVITSFIDFVITNNLPCLGNCLYP